MDGQAFASIVVAVVTTLGTVYAAYLAARSGKLGRLSKVEDVAVLKERAEVSEQKASLWQTKYEAEVMAHTAEVAAHVETRARAEFAERSSDQCERRLSAVYAELAAAGKLVDRREEGRA